MAGFDLDLRSAEQWLPDDDEQENGPRIILGVLDGRTEPAEWIAAVEDGNVLVLDVEGDLNELAAGFARQIKDEGGRLVHFKGFLIVSPAGVDIDTDRLD